MSSGLMLNGGTAENFIINSGGSSATVATRLGNSASPEASHYDSWQPEDLVATVQFLATLDAERMPYVLPEELRALDPCNPHSPPSSGLYHPSASHATCNSHPIHWVSDEPSDVGGVADADVAGVAAVTTQLQLQNDCDLSSSLSDGEEQVQQVREPLPAFPHDDHVVLVTAATAATAAVATVAADQANSSMSTCGEERSIIKMSNKPAHLKRVSFGSNKGGSMVETLIYESAIGEEEASAAALPNWKTSKNQRNLRTLVAANDPTPEESVALLSDSSTRSASKVRVTYFESKRPLTLPSPEASDAEWDDTMAEPPTTHHPNYNRQISNESGQDNPFRPDGDLSREADELVELLKGGRPISEVLKPKTEALLLLPSANEPVAEEEDQQQQQQQQQQPLLASSPVGRNSLASPTSNKSSTDAGGVVNGVKTPEAEKKALEKKAEASKSSVEVGRAVLAPTEANPSQAEHVVIKKKSKCQCCVIQ